MTDNEIIRAFGPLIRQQYPELALIQKNSPTQQGTSTQNAIYFAKIGDERFGFSGETQIKNPDNTISCVSEQFYFTTFEFSALALQFARDSTRPTASDILNDLAGYFQSFKIVEDLKTFGLNITKVKMVNNEAFEDDAHVYEFMPKLLIEFAHKRSFTYQVNSISTFDLNVNSVS